MMQWLISFAIVIGVVVGLIIAPDSMNYYLTWALIVGVAGLCLLILTAVVRLALFGYK
jgi:hypothetical protein